MNRHNPKTHLQENYYNFPSHPVSCFNYYHLRGLPAPQQMFGAGFGRRTIRDVMEWKTVMGNAPYPWGPNGDQFMYVQK